ncbi:hypothetical protein BDY24DRAFT_379051 [Mrakia frigida]|uniref:uncharacterized protein n=1 Tax=Mrakia frigida TaxID=29902 RepID=UPI003FCBFF7B
MDRGIPKNLSRVPDRQLPRPVAALRRKPSTTSIPYASYHTNAAPPTFLKRVATAAKQRPTRTVAGAVVLLFFLWWLVFSVTFESEHVHPMLAQMAVPSGGLEDAGKSFDDVKRRKSILNGISPRSSSIPPTIPFTPKEELASLVNFLVSNPSHSLPLNIDPSVPLLPDMILDVPLPSALDCRARVLEELEKDTWEK